MNDLMNELELIITHNLQSINKLKNDVEKKVYEKHDQLKEIALGIIDVLDSFDRIEDGMIEKGLSSVESVSKIINRYKTVQKKLLFLLQKYGITKIEFPDNRLIVGLCEVVETEVDSNRKNDDIITVVRNGYIRGKEVIRTAQIIVVKN